MAKPDDILFSLFREQMVPPASSPEAEQHLLAEIERRFNVLLLPWLLTSGLGHFLEIGCGDGKYGHYIADHVSSYTGVEIRPASISSAQALFEPKEHCRVMGGDGRTLTGIENESVDYVFSYQSFLYMPELSIIESYLTEISRVLSPTGCARIQLPGPNLRSSVRLAWRTLGTLSGKMAEVAKSVLPLDTMVPALRWGPVESHWGNYGATLSARDAIYFAKKLGVKAEVVPCHYGRPMNGNLSGTYWLVMYKGEVPPFFLTMG